ncbi:MAG: hypothetical protein ACO3I0_07370 [Limisphaerales bacterium]|jgi:hypothetical protein
MKPGILRRLGVILAAWAIGWLVYMVAMAMTVYDGILSLIFQPIIAVFVSAACVGVALLVGLLFRIPTLGRLWCSNRLIAVGLALLSISVMLFGSSIGLTETFTDTETGRQFVGLHSAVGLSCYFLLIFAVANFPFQKPNALVS